MSIPSHVRAAAWDVIPVELTPEGVDAGLDLVDAYYESLLHALWASVDASLELLEGATGAGADVAAILSAALTQSRAAT